MSDSIRLFWKKSATKAQHYQIRYKRKEEQENWTIVQTDQEENVILITELMSDTGYIFQVRGVYENQQGCFGPENNALRTSKSLGSNLLKYSIKGPKGSPQRYQLVADEQRKSRNEDARTKKVILGKIREVNIN